MYTWFPNVLYTHQSIGYHRFGLLKRRYRDPDVYSTIQLSWIASVQHDDHEGKLGGR